MLVAAAAAGFVIDGGVGAGRGGFQILVLCLFHPLVTEGIAVDEGLARVLVAAAAAGFVIDGGVGAVGGGFEVFRIDRFTPAVLQLGDEPNFIKRFIEARLCKGGGVGDHPRRRAGRVLGLQGGNLCVFGFGMTAALAGV